MTYDKLSRTITDSQGEQRMLSPQCGVLFEMLMDNQGTIITRDAMRKSIWGHQSVSEDRINHLVCRLRKELKALPEECPWHIEVIPKVGYRLSIADNHHHLKHWLHRWVEWVHHIIK